MPQGRASKLSIAAITITGSECNTAAMSMVCQAVSSLTDVLYCSHQEASPGQMTTRSSSYYSPFAVYEIAAMDLANSKRLSMAKLVISVLE